MTNSCMIQTSHKLQQVIIQKITLTGNKLLPEKRSVANRQSEAQAKLTSNHVCSSIINNRITNHMSQLTQ